MNEYYLGYGMARTDALIAAMDSKESVGGVTTGHAAADAIAVKLQIGKSAEAMAIARWAFPFLGTMGLEEYTSPFVEKIDFSGIPVVQLKHALVKEVMERGAKMRLTVTNVYSFIRDIKRLKRLFQEATVDTDKKGGFIFIPYLARLKKAKVMFKDQDKKNFGLNIIWDYENYKPRNGWIVKECNGHLGITKAGETRSTYVEEKKVNNKEISTMHVNDFLHELSMSCLDRCEEMANKFINSRPDDAWIISKLQELKNKFYKDEFFKAITLLHIWYKENMFTSLTNAEKLKLSEVRASYAKAEKKQLQEMERRVRKEYSPRFEWFRNEVRRGVHVFCKLAKVHEKYSNTIMAEAAILASFYAGKDESGDICFVSNPIKASSYAHRIMSAEVAKYVLDHLREDFKEEIPDYSVDFLDSCDDNLVGRKIKMEEGVFISKEGYKAEANYPFEGHFIVGKIGEGDLAKYYIRRNLDDILKTSSIDFDRIMIVTKTGEGDNRSFWSDKLDNFMEEWDYDSTIKLEFNENYISLKDPEKEWKTKLMKYRIPFINLFPNQFKNAIMHLFCNPWDGNKELLTAHIEDFVETDGTVNTDGINLKSEILFIKTR